MANSRNLLLTVFHSSCTLLSPKAISLADIRLTCTDRRWDTDYIALSSLVRGGTLGQIIEFESHFDTHSPAMRDGWSDTWRSQAGTGSGVLYDRGSHLIDQALALLGKPTSVTALLGYERSSEFQYGDPDSMTILLRFSDGTLATLKASVINVADKVLRFKVRGRKGTFIKVSILLSHEPFRALSYHCYQYHLDPQESQIVSGTAMPGGKNLGVEDAAHFGKVKSGGTLRVAMLRRLGTLSVLCDNDTVKTNVLPQPQPLTYGALFDAVADGLEGKASNFVTAESARDVVRVLELAEESAKTGRTLQFLQV